MEKDIKQHSITYNKGITNQPSYILTDDGELSSCNGLTFENGELKPIQNPSTVDGAPSQKILLVHDGRYLFLDHNTNNIYYNNTSSGNFVMSIGGLLTDISTVGNTVIASSTLGTYYALWEGSRYTYLGDKIPEPDVELKLVNNLSLTREGVARFMGQYRTKIFYYDMVEEQGVLSNHQQEFNDVVWAAMRKMIRDAHEDSLFTMPFVARVAVELYDGSYTLHSAPQIMLPWYGGNCYLFKTDDMSSCGYLFITASALFYKINNSGTTSYDKWNDIVKSITIFISREHNIFHEDADYKNITIDDTWDNSPIYGGYYFDSVNSKSVVKNIGTGLDYFYLNDRVPPFNNAPWDEVRLILDGKSEANVLGGLKEESVFFKLCDIGLKSTNGYVTTNGKFGSNILTSIEVQQQLPNEDFHSHDAYANGNLYSYNGRLHVTNMKRSLFNGFNTFFKWDTSSSYDYTIVVTIKTNSGNKKVKVGPFSTNESIGRFYFYYPDSRATQAEIYVGNPGVYWKTITLTEHPGLNGAYWCSGYWPTDSNNGFAPGPSPSSGSVPTNLDSIETLNDTLMVSEANNPMLFLPKGFTNIGNGDIVGIAAVTMALNEYQHGHTPLVAFCTDGIYSLSITSDGYYDSVQAVSREVCISEKTITQVDMGIYFVSKKGLMYMDTSGVKCVSQQMKGTSFEDYIDDCLMAYDYRDSLLHIYRSSRPETYHYVYNMKTGTFTTQSGNDIDNVVNNYPDTLVQDVGTSVKSLLNKPDEKDDPATNYSATLTARPMKFGNILTLKSIRQIRHLYAMNTNATVELTIKASNDGVNWATLTSLRGKPWKLYRFEITMTGLKATDRYAGTVVWTQERRTEKLR